MLLLVIESIVILALGIILFALFVSEYHSNKRVTPQARVDAYWRGAERRKFYRFHRVIDATYRRERKQHIRTYCRTADISEGGLRLVIDAKFSSGDILDLHLSLPNADKDIELEGKVVWCDEAKDLDDPSGKQLFHAGIQFCGISPANVKALTGYIRSLTESPET